MKKLLRIILLSALLGSVAPVNVLGMQENTDASNVVTNPAETDLEIRYPIDVAADSQGVIYVADRQLPGIWKIVDGQSEVFFQAEKRYRTPLNAVRCLAVDAQDTLFAGCSTSTEVYRFDAGKPVALSGGKVSVPMNMVIDGDQVLVCDLKMRMLDSIPTAGGELKELAEVQGAKAVVKVKDGFLVLTGTENPILLVNPETGETTPFLTGRPFNFPADMVVLADQSLVVSDSYGKCLWKVVDGKAEKWVEDDRFSNPVGLCLSGENVIMADSRANAIFSISPAGQVTVVWQGQPTP